ncbi:HlyD family secretion protein [Pseudochelatococcus lubricantis]|uniref:HlyD family secretion protein n=1 Tax=Pseudochelatococcus lubricantis TaxID=1538102 RepID=A0ABX0V716_9HYPH|nr:biotin/lipoyl-binding protein [Pseudochelatococcus lubricantis]NIJ59889.1 HlyD family secretion protein [Pseudochelatococcus lubricantis]
MSEGSRKWLTVGIVLVLAAAAYFGWKKLQPAPLPDGIASGNGRIEATEIDVASKAAGRVKEVLVREGDFVTAGQILARMDTDQLQAQKRQAEAQLQQAIIAVQTAKNQVAQRRAEQAAAVAVVAQRDAELDAANKKLARSEQLIVRDNISQQTLDDDRARALGAKAALEAAKAQLAAAEAAILAAESQVVGAEAAVDAARATIEKIEADIADSVLTSPRDGRVQFLVAQVGEVLAAGGRVLNLVDLSDVYMTFFLPTDQAGLLALGAEARIVLDAAPQYVLPAKISFVADVAQFTPKTVETAVEREKLMFRIRAQISPDLLRKYIEQVKTGLPGLAYVKLRPDAQWPEALQKTVSP